MDRELSFIFAIYRVMSVPPSVSRSPKPLPISAFNCCITCAVTASEQVAGHFAAHVADADKADTHRAGPLQAVNPGSLCSLP
ncbi:MAG TPA: hypothetical protein VMV70_09485 [Gallionella sp.]|nr:hypothetical protein [Gallionella sp.]